MSTASRSPAATVGKPRGKPPRPNSGEPPTSLLTGEFVLESPSAVESIDEVIHQKARLGIMSTLMALGEADFKMLKETLNLSDGNLSTHLRLLEEHGYVEVRKEFRGRKPHTTAVASPKGRAAFNAYLEALERIIRSARG